MRCIYGEKRHRMPMILQCQKDEQISSRHQQSESEQYSKIAVEGRELLGLMIYQLGSAEIFEQILGTSVQRHVEGVITCTMKLLLIGSERNWELVLAGNTKH